MTDQSAVSAAGSRKTALRQHISRHRLFDRLFHWCMAASIFVLLGTAFLPIWGLKFPWLVPHWVTGFILTALILIHIVRALFFQDMRKVIIWVADFREFFGGIRAGLKGGEGPKPGKYSFAQKSYHTIITVTVLTSIVTGLLMMVKQDTPLWNRNPYWLADSQWGWIYVFHGFAAIVVLAMLLMHIYFAIRPEKLFYTRSMIKGWITEDEYKSHHDASRWKASASASEKSE